MSMPYEPHDTACPRCGYPETVDRGPYEVAFPEMTADHGCPEVHYLTCGRCGKGFDAGPEEAAAKWQALFDRRQP